MTKIGIATPQDMKARTLAIARGEIAVSKDDPKLWVPNAETKAAIEAAERGETVATGSVATLLHELNGHGS